MIELRSFICYCTRNFTSVKY
uniref:Uncharacterized protein n=1 Tax=Rhizophora mucronata TaxID=61149 RepID=A0A2P2Q0G3_RHIMU